MKRRIVDGTCFGSSEALMKLSSAPDIRIRDERKSNSRKSAERPGDEISINDEIRKQPYWKNQGGCAGGRVNESEEGRTVCRCEFACGGS